MLIQKKQDNLH